MFLNGMVKIGNRGDDPRLRGVAISATCRDADHVGEQLRSPQTFDSFGRASSLLRSRSFPLVQSREMQEGREPRLFRARVRRAEQQFDVG